MRHPKLVAWEKKLKRTLDRIDTEMENKYGHSYPLHPARSKHGTTSNRKQDGLFSIDAAFTPGYGSKIGRGYIIRIRMVTLSQIPQEIRTAMEKEIVTKLRRSLPRMFPGKNLKIDKDGHAFKIHGDLSLGDI